MLRIIHDIDIPSVEENRLLMSRSHCDCVVHTLCSDYMGG